MNVGWKDTLAWYSNIVTMAVASPSRKAINEYNNHAYFILKYHLQSKLLFVVKECLYFNVSMNVSKGFHP